MKNELERIFNQKTTENGDVAFKSLDDNLLNIFFMAEYYTKHIDEVRLGGYTDRDKIFAMFMRDPRFGMGYRDLGRELMKQADVTYDNVVKAGRYDDLLHMAKNENGILNREVIEYLWGKVIAKDNLAKKWMPRFHTKNAALAKQICHIVGVQQKDYRKAIKVPTVESQLTAHNMSEINFAQVPSLAMIKYFNKFKQDPRFEAYLESVKQGKAKLNVATTTVYDIYKNRFKIDADLFFDKLDKINISCIPILDTSGSMWDENDSIGKANAIAYYLAKNSTYCNGYVVSFSSHPQLIKLAETVKEAQDHTHRCYAWGFDDRLVDDLGAVSKFNCGINSMFTGDCSNTDFGQVIKLLSQLNEYPDYFVVLSDMEFDYGSRASKEQVMRLFKEKGIKTRIIWWNFNSRNTTAPEMDSDGNVFISGYSPMLLRYLQAGFDGQAFLNELLDQYQKQVVLK